MKKHGGIPGIIKRQVANPYFVGQLKKRRAKKKVAKQARKVNR